MSGINKESSWQGSPQNPIIPVKDDLDTLWNSVMHATLDGEEAESPATKSSGIRLHAAAQVKHGGPFCPFRASSVTAGTNDYIVVGMPAEGVTGTPATYLKGRTATTPGILMVDSVTKMFTTPEPVQFVDCWPSWPPSGTTDTRLLTLSAIVSGATITTAYTYLTNTNISANLYPNWKKDGILYFPLGWVTVTQTSVDSSTYWKISSIVWANESWVLQGSGGSSLTPIIITGGSGSAHTGNVYGNGMGVSPTESGVVIKILQIAASAIIPTGTYLPASKIKWTTGGITTEYWTVDIARWYA